ncbi:MAG: valine--tRNA ligase, partial [Deltaproteobacteria bacterium]|nr:valine--tRNA ligase [Deltaproteobacteria bacterium]
VAVHPEDERYKSLQGKTVVVPLVQREVKVIADSFVDITFGTGCLKVTPAHDPNDYLIGKRHGLPFVTIMDETAHLTKVTGVYAGLSREQAREKVLQDLKAQGLLEKEEPYLHSVGHCDRCGVAVEPRLSSQWFVNAAELAKEAIRVVECGEIRIIPSEWEKTYYEWMRNIRPWCISRQLWWGHRIPVWYCESCKEMIAQKVDPSQCPKCGSRSLKQDEDVLDTWFSSGLWPISTMGWPEATFDLRTFYPTDVLETGFDILFFWVARMIMMGLKMTGKIPFHTVYLHPMVRDEYGQKMSKTKGNVKDPLEIINRTGADSLRFTLAAMAVHGRDVLLSDSRIEGYRNFVNKIWNATRFVLMNFADVKQENKELSNEINQWIWSRLNAVKADVNVALDQYRFFDAANRLYQFIWSDYCDWFLEFTKSEQEFTRRQQSGDSTAVQVLEAALRLLHPLMPFVTEELWHKLPLKPEAVSISVAPYPQANDKENYPATEKKIGRIISIVEAVRSKRGENQLSPAATIRLALHASHKILEDIKPFASLICKLVKVSDIQFDSSEAGASKGQVMLAVEDLQVTIPREDLINTEKETERVSVEISQMTAELDRAVSKLKNSDFMSKAPPDVIEGVRARSQALERKLTALRAYFEELKSSK